MSVVFRAVDEPVESRVDYWQQVIHEHLIPMNVQLHAGPDLRDELVVGSLGALRVAEWTTGPGETSRTSKQIRDSDPEWCQIFTQLEGRVVGIQDGRTNELAPGDVGVVDPSLPLRCIHSAHRGVLIAFPRTLMSLRGHELSALMGSRIPGDHGAGALVSGLMRQIPRYLAEESGAAAARLGTSVVDLLAVALAARVDHVSAVPPDARQRALSLRVRAFIEERLGDPTLTPRTIAAAHHISVRYLHKLFRDEGVAGAIRQRRLERCRRDLLDPALAARPVGATAARWGFANAAHFNRLFRDTYGAPPAEFRRMHGGAVGAPVRGTAG
jgi:AraC-like DNA-binding protein